MPTSFALGRVHRGSSAEARRRLHTAVSRGQHDRADALLPQLLTFLRFIIRHGLPRTVKAGLAIQDRPAGPPRPPLPPLPQDDTRQLRTMLTRLLAGPLSPAVTPSAT
ncbi:hypothetical protein [Streptomyces katrae]|uniref:hypothetical protein n=1 Tax=Streptomyces katrae TaxID=68223 RepID=UPI000A9F7735|nr:hypothetical protein [Streptomyces katrae]